MTTRRLATFDEREAVIAQLAGALHCARLERSPVQVSLDGWSVAQREIFDELLGAGQIHLAVSLHGSVDIHSAGLKGVWRTHRVAPDGRSMGEELEVGASPHLLRDANASLPTHLNVTPQALGVRALLGELSTRSQAWRPERPNSVLALTLGHGDRAELASLLGRGPVVADCRRRGTCEARLTRLRSVWWVHFFSDGVRPGREALEIGQAPAELCFTPEELGQSEAALLDVLGWPTAC